MKDMMARMILYIVALALGAATLWGQDSNILRHYSLSAGVGTTGVTIDAGTMVTDYVGIRGGIDLMPHFKYSTELSLNLINQTQEIGIDLSPLRERKVEVEGTLHNTTGHALLDIYPLPRLAFHVTVGAYIAGDDDVVDVVSGENEMLKKVADLNARRGMFAMIPLSYGQVAAKMGDYNIMPDDNGNARAQVKVRKVRPYLGIGYGRAVPHSRLNCQIDVGVQLSGKPRVYNGVNGEEITADGARGEDGGLLRSIDRVKCYPVLSVRLAGRIF
jgi:hypothetical protein